MGDAEACALELEGLAPAAFPAVCLKVTPDWMKIGEGTLRATEVVPSQYVNFLRNERSFLGGSISKHT
jgi:hypothetical protein